jgi:hypothetical protein
MFSSSFPYASLLQQQPFPQRLHSGQCFPFGQGYYQSYQNPGQESQPSFQNQFQPQFQPQFMNQQATYGMQSPQMNVALEELMRDRQRDIYLDNVIMKLLESSRFYRQSDQVLRHFVEGKVLSKEEVFKDFTLRLSRIYLQIDKRIKTLLASSQQLCMSAKIVQLIKSWHTCPSESQLLLLSFL